MRSEAAVCVFALCVECQRELGEEARDRRQLCAACEAKLFREESRGATRCELRLVRLRQGGNR
jgi:hypothetical protein